ncbi:MAG: hypothetical protein ACRC0R_06505 [Cetobacterium sp.]
MAERKISSGRNQKSIFESMIKRYVQLSGNSHSDLTENDPIYMLLETVSHGIGGLGYYHDRSFLELNPKTAQTESGKANLISSYGGSLDFFRGATGNLKVYIKEGSTETYIKRYSEFTFEDNTFYCERDVLIDLEHDEFGDYLIIPVREGTVKSVKYSKNDILNSGLLIRSEDNESSGACYESFSVVNQGDWKRVEDVYFHFVNKRIGEDNKVFSVSKNMKRNPIVKLYYGWEDFISKYSDHTFNISYCVTKGSQVNVPKGVELKPKDGFILSATSETPLNGGYSPDYSMDRQLSKSIEQSRTMWTAVTKEDFDILSQENKDILCSVVYDIDSDNLELVNYSLRDMGLDTIRNFDFVISLIGNGGEVPNQKIVDEVFEVLNQRKISIFRTRYVPAELIKVNYDITISSFSDNISLSKNDVRELINTYYMNNTKFGDRVVSNSKLIQGIHNLNSNIVQVELSNDLKKHIENVGSFVTERNLFSSKQFEYIKPFAYYSLGEINLTIKVVR